MSIFCTRGQNSKIHIIVSSFAPLGLTAKVDWFTPLIVALVSYPLFSLDEIGAELQNPFSPRNLSHLPLNDICNTIESNVMSLEKSE